MARLSNIKQRRHQPFWSTLVRETGVLAGAAVISSGARLFQSVGGGLGVTNMQTSGQLPGDQTYVILAARCFMHFEGTNKRALYLNVSSQLTFTLNVGEKAQFSAPAWYFPAGGGISGVDAGAGTGIFSNGEPNQKAIMVLAKPISVPARQHFNVECTFSAVGVTNALDLLNGGAANDQKVITFFIDGVHTRDVE